MTPSVAHYAEGTGHLVVATNTAVLLDPDTPEGLVGRLWTLVQDGADVPSLVDVLLEYGLRRLRTFGLVQLRDDGAQVILRGDVRGAALDHHEGGREVTASGAVIGGDYFLPGVVQVSLARAGATADRAGLPLLGGVVRADAVVVGLGLADTALSAGLSSAASGERSGAEHMPLDRPSVAEPQSAAPIGGRDSESPQEVAEAEGLLDDSAVPAPDDRDGELPEDASSAAALELTVPPSTETIPGFAFVDCAAVAEAADGDGVSGPADADDDYDRIFGATRHATVEEAAVREQDPDPAASRAPTMLPQPAPLAPLQEPERATSAEDASSPSAAGAQGAPTGLIDAVPGSGPFAVPAPPAPSQQWSSDHDGMTIARSQLPRLQQAAAPASPADPRAVLAVRCPAGHLNPPQAHRCRLCTQAVAEQQPVSVLRPVLGRLRFSTGVEVDLDRSVIIGRSPRVERIASNLVVPQLVTLPSPGQDISRNHAEVQLEGWHVLVRDLGSTNGTVVTLPGRPPERLRSDEALPIVPGTLVSLADEATFTYEVTA